MREVAGGRHVQLLLEVTPEGGGGSVVHEQVHVPAEASRDEPVAGNVARVRLGLGGRLAWPSSPVERIAADEGGGS